MTIALFDLGRARSFQLCEHLVQFRVGYFSIGRINAQPVPLDPWDNMDVKMVDDLPGLAALVDEYVKSFECEPAFQALSGVPDSDEGLLYLPIGAVDDQLEVLLGHDEAMAWRSGIDVEERDNGLVLVKRSRRYHPGNDLAKHAFLWRELFLPFLLAFLFCHFQLPC